MKNTLLIMILALAAFSALPAGIHNNAGQYGYQFLDVSTNPVSLALAGRGIGSGSDLSAFLRQPAASALSSHRALGASHMLWLADTAANNLHYSWSDRKKHFGMALRTLDYGELEIRDDNGLLIGTYSPLNVDLLGNYALRVSPSLYAGINAGVAYEKLNTDSSYGLHTDLGLTWLTPVKDTKFNLAVRNLGISSAMNEERTAFPISLELDLNKTFDLGDNAIEVELSGIKAIDENWKGAISAEFNLYGLAFLRAGYKINHDAEDLSAGLGFRWKSLGIDYGWASFSSHLSDVHSFGLSYYF
ncbi:MAG: PorV/PorQ family protein [Candidatus Cloacimonetes bacterium]|nr:PorV/PorQ family protein [Candidatus Cloacimonadota bacterium]